MSSPNNPPIRESMYIDGMMSAAWVRFFENLYQGRKGVALEGDVSTAKEDITDLSSDQADIDARLVITEASITEMLGGLFWPVGSIYISVTPANPSTTLGFGTWSAFGSGRVPVGIDSTDTDFDTAEETGGAKTHTHNVDIASTTSGTPSATTDISDGAGSTVSLASATHTHTTDPASTTTTASSSLPPYIAVYMWKRTA